MHIIDNRIWTTLSRRFIIIIAFSKVLQRNIHIHHEIVCQHKLSAAIHANPNVIKLVDDDSVNDQQPENDPEQKWTQYMSM